MGTVIDFKTGKVHKDDEPQCAFCKRSKSQVKALIHSNIKNQCICDACIAKCKSLLNLPTEKELA